MSVINPATRSALETRVLALLASGPLTTAEIMRALECSFSVAYGVMAGLRETGAVQFDVVRGVRHGKGRTAYVYSLVRV